MVVYFDTSAVNYFWSRLSTDDAIATKAFQEEHGRRWVISPVTIWEILNTSDVGHREELIFFAQHLFDESLMPSPEEFLIDFINSGCPSTYRAKDFRSNCDLAETWRNICQDKRKTFVFDHEDLRERFRMIAPITRDLHKLSRNRSTAIDRLSAQSHMDLSLENLVANLSWIRDGGLPSEKDRKVYKIAIFYVMFFLCAEVGVDPGPIRQFWKQVGVSNVLDRIHYVLSELEVIVRRGPILLMATMTLVQAERKFSRGIYWDSLHCAYITYVDWMLAEDQHFLDLRTVLDGHPYQQKIHRPSEMLWRHYRQS
jgi:hypothetical protein